MRLSYHGERDTPVMVSKAVKIASGQSLKLKSGDGGQTF
jgi:hypothetical protein